MSMVGKWDGRYRKDPRQRPYGDDTTYQAGAEFLAPCSRIEDWGCGRGWFRKFIGPETEYVGLDGSKTPFADKIVDLATYRSDPPTPGLFMRGVLEHNPEWRSILANAFASFSERMVVIVTTPFEQVERVIHRWEFGVPDISLRWGDLLACFPDGSHWTRREYRTKSRYKVETFLTFRRP